MASATIAALALVLSTAAQAELSFYSNGKLTTHEPFIEAGELNLAIPANARTEPQSEIFCRYTATGELEATSAEVTGFQSNCSGGESTESERECHVVGIKHSELTAETPATKVGYQGPTFEHPVVARSGSFTLPWKISLSAESEKTFLTTSGVQLYYVNQCKSINYPAQSAEWEFTGSLTQLVLNGSKNALSPTTLRFSPPEAKIHGPDGRFFNCACESTEKGGANLLGMTGFGFTPILVQVH